MFVLLLVLTWFAITERGVRVLQTRSIVVTWTGLTPSQQAGGRGHVQRDAVVESPGPGLTDLISPACPHLALLNLGDLTVEAEGLTGLQADLRARTQLPPTSNKFYLVTKFCFLNFAFS